MPEPRIWRLREPPIEGGDYAHTRINGSLDEPFVIPAVPCPGCKRPPRGRRLHLEAPAALRAPWRKEFGGLRRSISTVHAAIATVRAAFAEVGADAPDLQPGDKLLPAYLDIPAPPEVDFLWCAIETPVVSGRVRELLLAAGAERASFRPVTPRRVGSAKRAHKAAWPKDGEPESMLRGLPRAEAGSLPPYFLLDPVQVIPPPASIVTTRCAECGSPTIDRYDNAILDPQTCDPGLPVFRFIRGVWVSAEVRQRLASLGATNVAYSGSHLHD